MIFTSSGTNGATMAPTRASVEETPTPPLRIPVGSNSAVCTYTMPNADVMPSFPNRKRIVVNQTRSRNRIDKIKIHSKNIIQCI